MNDDEIKQSGVIRLSATNSVDSQMSAGCLVGRPEKNLLVIHSVECNQTTPSVICKLKGIKVVLNKRAAPFLLF